PNGADLTLDTRCGYRKSYPGWRRCRDGLSSLGMLDLLKLLSGWLVGLFRSHAAREAETAFLRQQLVVLKRSAPARLRLPTADRLIFVWLYRLFLPCSKPRLSSSLRG